MNTTQATESPSRLLAPGRSGILDGPSPWPPPADPRRLPLADAQQGLWLTLAGGAVVALGSLVARPAEGWSSLLTAAVFGTFLALGGLVFLAVNAASGAKWWAPIREVPLLLARTLPAPAILLGLCLVLGLPSLYSWARPGAVQASVLLQRKQAWLSAPLFLARAVVVFVVWFSFIEAFRKRLAVLRGDSSAVAERSLARASAAFLVVLAVTLSVAAWDWTMSLEPEWFSTMYAVYVFAGTFLGGIAAVTVLSLVLDQRGLLGTRLRPDQVHDLGKLLFAFATFWAYIWFCQYLLIWYSNLPEETQHYTTRFAGGWSAFFWLNPILNWLVPFVVLLAASPKRHPSTLLQVALLVLLGRWLDIYLLVAPAAGPAPAIPTTAIAATVALLAAMGLLLRRALRSHPMGPVA